MTGRARNLNEEREKVKIRVGAGCIGLVFALAAGSLATPAAIASEARQVRFAKGASSATLRGSVKGDQFVDYKLRARAGQTMKVSLKTSNVANYFNVLPPGSKDVAIFVGSRDGNEWSGALEADGEYTIRVYLMRNAARRDEAAKYTLTVGIAGAASAALVKPPASDAKVKGTAYHATGTVPCSMGDAAPGSAQCQFGVIRGSAGNAEVHVTPPGGFKRVLTFKGKSVSAGADAKVKAGRSDDNWVIEVNDYERYRIPDAVINGG